MPHNFLNQINNCVTSSKKLCWIKRPKILKRDRSKRPLIRYTRLALQFYKKRTKTSIRYAKENDKEKRERRKEREKKLEGKI